jgi:hypothetical protein
VTKTKVETQYNKTTRFILRSLKLNDSLLIQNGFVNAYIQDHEYDIRWDYENCIYLLFKPEQLEHFERCASILRSYDNFRDEYDTNEGIVFVFEIPNRYKSIIPNFIAGKYSQFDRNYIKECIPQVINGQISKRWKIFYKEQDLFQELATFLGYKDLNIAKKYIDELEDLPYAEEEIFRYNPEIEVKLTRKNQT